MHPVVHHVHRVHRISMAGLVLSTLIALVLPLFTNRNVSADQVQNRFIQMSDSASSGGPIPSGIGSGTNVTYTFSFGISNNPAYSPNMKSYIVDFCAEDPIIADTCTAPTGLDLTAATPISGNTAGWTITSTGSQVKATNAIGLPGNTQITLELGGITNPSTAGTFFARIYTYADTTWGGYVSPTNIGTNVDYGGVAMSTTNAISVTAAVMEHLTFCISGAPIGADCSGLSPANLTIGHGFPLIVDGSQVDSTNAYMQTSTNAKNGVIIRMENLNSCGGLSSNGGVSCPIPAAGNLPVAFSPGTARFGMNVAPSIGGIGSILPQAPYDQSVANKYAMDTTAGTGVTSTYGSQIANGGAVDNVENILTFAASASNVTPANTYSATFVMVATSTF